MEKKESLRNIIKQQRDKLSKELVKKDSKLLDESRQYVVLNEKN